MIQTQTQTQSTLPAIWRVLAIVFLSLVIVRDVSAQGEETYTEPEGRWSAPIPAGWTVEEGEGYVLVNSPEGDLGMYLLVSESDDYEQVAADSRAYRRATCSG